MRKKGRKEEYMEGRKVMRKARKVIRKVGYKEARKVIRKEGRL